MAGAVVVLAVGIAGGLIWRSRQARRLTEKDTIILGDFANVTGHVAEMNRQLARCDWSLKVTWCLAEIQSGLILRWLSDDGPTGS